MPRVGFLGLYESPSLGQSMASVSLGENNFRFADNPPRIQHALPHIARCPDKWRGFEATKSANLTYPGIISNPKSALSNAAISLDISPARMARATASVRLCACSLWISAFTWNLAVCSLIDRRSAMILFGPISWMSAPLALAFWMMLRRRSWKEEAAPAAPPPPKPDETGEVGLPNEPGGRFMPPG